MVPDGANCMLIVLDGVMHQLYANTGGGRMMWPRLVNVLQIVCVCASDRVCAPRIGCVCLG